MPAIGNSENATLYRETMLKVSDIASIGVKANLPTTIALDLKVARNIKTEQPAFKLVVKTADDAPVLLNLAIPFKPRPNYFLFGVTGFIFGGLIAVMVLIGKRKKA